MESSVCCFDFVSAAVTAPGSSVGAAPQPRPKLSFETLTIQMSRRPSQTPAHHIHTPGLAADGEARSRTALYCTSRLWRKPAPYDGSTPDCGSDVRYPTTPRICDLGTGVAVEACCYNYMRMDNGGVQSTVAAWPPSWFGTRPSNWVSEPRTGFWRVSKHCLSPSSLPHPALYHLGKLPSPSITLYVVARLRSRALVEHVPQCPSRHQKKLGRQPTLFGPCVAHDYDDIPTVRMPPVDTQTWPGREE